MVSTQGQGLLIFGNGGNIYDMAIPLLIPRKSLLIYRLVCVVAFGLIRI